MFILLSYTFIVKSSCLKKYITETKTFYFVNQVCKKERYIGPNKLLRYSIINSLKICFYLIDFLDKKETLQLNRYELKYNDS